MLTRPPSQRDSDTSWGSKEVRDLCSGGNSVVDPGQPGAPSHHWRADDDCRGCVGWDLLWLGPYDVVVIEMTVFAMQVASKP